MRGGWRRQRGQASVEMALFAPLLFLLVLGSADFGRALDLKIEMTGASRAGMRTGVAGGSNDIGAAVRSEPNAAIKNDTVTWGTMAPNGATPGTRDCSGGAVSCGDTSGCVPGSFTGTTTACFAIRSCPRLSASNTFATASPPCSAWGVRPASQSGDALEVKVVYRFAPFTKPIAAYTGSGGYFFLAGDTLAVESY